LVIDGRPRRDVQLSPCRILQHVDVEQDDDEARFVAEEMHRMDRTHIIGVRGVAARIDADPVPPLRATLQAMVGGDRHILDPIPLRQEREEECGLLAVAGHRPRTVTENDRLH
jgi:hypothetical protein